MGRKASLALWLSLAGALGACRDEPHWLRVERVEPGHGASGDVLIAVNQAITVYFSEPVDPSTVTRESFRVVDSNGHGLRTGAIEVGTRSVRFQPRAPVEPDLADGSFRPGERYRVEVPGLPTIYAIQSRAGDSLEHGIARTFRVSDDPRELGLPTPFLPASVDTDPLRLDVAAAGLPRMAAGAGVLELRFSQPLLPASVRLDSFRVWRILAGGDAPEELRPIGARILGEPLPGTLHWGSCVRLEFDAAARIAATDVLYLGLSDGDAALRDYRGRKVEPLPVAIPIKVDPGDRVRMRDLDLNELRLIRDPGAALGFETRSGRIVARAFAEAGTGSAGAFVARDSTVIAPGRAFDRGDGNELPAAGPGLEFTTLEVPRDAELRLRADVGGLVLRVCGDVQIRGRLVLEGTARRLPWRPGEEPPVESLARAGGAVIVAGGDFVIADGGEIVAESDGTGCPLVVVAGGDVRIGGVIPPSCGFALRDGARFVGLAEQAIRWRTTLTPGLPAGVSIDAASWTDWIPLPDYATSIDLNLADPRDGIVAWLQVAPPHAVDPARPLVEPELLTPAILLPLAEPLVVERGAFFRIGLMGSVHGAVTPSIAGFAIHER